MKVAWTFKVNATIRCSKHKDCQLPYAQTQKLETNEMKVKILLLFYEKVLIFLVKTILFQTISEVDNLCNNYNLLLLYVVQKLTIAIFVIKELQACSCLDHTF